VTGLYTGNYPFIVLNDWKLAKSLFAREEFSGRINNYTTSWAHCFNGVTYGLAFTDATDSSLKSHQVDPRVHTPIHPSNTHPVPSRSSVNGGPPGPGCLKTSIGAPGGTGMS